MYNARISPIVSDQSQKSKYGHPMTDANEIARAMTPPSRRQADEAVGCAHGGQKHGALRPGAVHDAIPLLARRSTPIPPQRTTVRHPIPRRWPA